MQISPRLALSFASALLAPSAFGQVDVVLDQQPNFGLITYSDAQCDVCGGPPLGSGQQVVADNVTINASGTFQMNQVVVWGGHSEAYGLTDRLELHVYADSAGFPAGGTPVYSESMVPHLAQTTGTYVYNSEVIKYTLNLTNPPQLTSGTYWISVFNDTTGSTSTWGIVSADLDTYNGIDGFTFSDYAPGITWYPDGYPAGNVNRNFAMQVIGTGATVGGPISSFCYGTSCPCANNDSIAGCYNSTGVGARVDYTGSSSLAAADLDVTCSGMRSGQSAWLFAGTNQMNGGAGTIMGDGLRCAGGQLQRIGLRTSDAGGGAQWNNLSLGALGWVPGDRRYLQVWYSDLASAPCGSPFNLSSALQIDVLP